jgi:hypothetical protein
MTISFESYLTACLVALGDSAGTTWSRINRMMPWCIEAIRTFPILRPMKDDHTNGASIVYNFAAAIDFREVISVEYPVGGTPITYLVRKYRLDPTFYKEAGYYDIDHDYSTGTGWLVFISGGLAASAHIYTQYLAQHDTAMTDSPTCYITVPDEYIALLIANVMCRAYRERLSFQMQNPTAQTSVISQLTTMVAQMEQSYQEQVAMAVARLTTSIVSPRMASDKFDRVY